MTHLQMYLFTRLDSVVCFCTILGVLFIIATCLLVFVCTMEEELGFLEKHWWKAVVPASIFILLSLSIPTQKEAAAIWLIPEIVNNEKVQNITTSSLSILEEQTKEWLRDLTQED